MTDKTLSRSFEGLETEHKEVYLTAHEMKFLVRLITEYEETTVPISFHQRVMITNIMHHLNEGTEDE